MQHSQSTTMRKLSSDNKHCSAGFLFCKLVIPDLALSGLQYNECIQELREPNTYSKLENKHM